jgi:hypothetical protein
LRTHWTTLGIITALAVAIGIAIALVAGGSASPVAGDATGTPLMQEEPAPTETEDENGKTPNDHLTDIGSEVSDFGGMRLNPDDPTVLQVYMLDPENTEKVDAVKNAIEETFPGAAPSGGIEILQGQYGILSLASWYDDLRTAINDSTWAAAGMSYTDLAEEDNRLEIGVISEEYAEDMRTLLAASTVPADAVNIVVRPRAKMLSTLRDKIRPAVGGLQVETNDSNIGICTMGFNAKRYGVKGFVMNSHCTSIFGYNDGSIIYQPIKANGNRIGREYRDGQLNQSQGEMRR